MGPTFFPAAGWPCDSPCSTSGSCQMLDSIGSSVNDTKSDTSTAKATVTPNCMKMRPIMPPMKATGKNTATTASDVAVFFPVAFMGGMIGRIFMQFGVTVAFAVLVSLFVSFTLDPMLSSIWHDPEVEHGESHGHPAAGKKVGPIRRVAFAFNAWFERVADRYPSWLGWSLRHRGLVM